MPSTGLNWCKTLHFCSFSIVLLLNWYWPEINSFKAFHVHKFYFLIQNENVILLNLYNNVFYIWTGNIISDLSPFHIFGSEDSDFKLWNAGHAYIVSTSWLPNQYEHPIPVQLLLKFHTTCFCENLPLASPCQPNIVIRCLHSLEEGEGL